MPIELHRKGYCEWCDLTTKELKKEIARYTQIISEATEAADEMGGSIRCKPEDRVAVDYLENLAAGHEDDRYHMRLCLAAREAKGSR